MSPLPELQKAITTPQQLSLITSTLTAPSTFLLSSIISQTPASTPLHLLSALSPPVKTGTNVTIHTTPASLTKALASADAAKPPLLLLHEPGWDIAAKGRTAVEVLDEIRGWHQRGLATVVFTSIDDALMGTAGEGRRRMEEEHRAFVVTLGHQAGIIVGTRPLGTGWARDVSGVLTIGGSEWAGSGVEREAPLSGEVEEWLYHIKEGRGDGGVEVFKRGEMRG